MADRSPGIDWLLYSGCTLPASLKKGEEQALTNVEVEVVNAAMKEMVVRAAQIDRIFSRARHRFANQPKNK